MKTSLVAIVITFAGIASGQQATTQPQTQPAAPAQTQTTPSGQTTAPGQTQGAAPARTQAAPAQPQQKKEIKDPAEYNAYVGAVQQTDPNAKISGLEAFLAQYANSVMKEDALELLMVAYQQANNQAKMIDTAQRILQVNPNNLRALALLSYIKRAQAEAGQDPQNNLTQGAQYADRGLQALQTAPKPDGTSDADFNKMKTQMSAIFNGASGMAALQAKNYPEAQQRLRAAVQADPNDLRNVYPLALADLTGTPPNSVEGLYFIARAADLAAGQPSQAQIESYGKSQYTKYHGSDQGWTDVEAQAKTNPMPPAGFTITQYVPPTPAQQAADLAKTKAPKDMSFAEWELVLSAGVPADADKVWSVIKGVPLQMEGTVIKASPTELQIAASEDDIEKKQADVIVTMGGTIPTRLMPQEGSTLDFEGTPVSYTPNPFVMTMEKGALLTKAAPKKPVHHRPSTQQ
jgi:tetratricopeptide (TPR) repeat protein